VLHLSSCQPFNPCPKAFHSFNITRKLLPFEGEKGKNKKISPLEHSGEPKLKGSEDTPRGFSFLRKVVEFPGKLGQNNQGGGGSSGGTKKSGGYERT
jgi:hypothetical protein